MSLSSARALGGVRVSGNQAHRATNKFAASNGAKWNMRRKDSYMVEGAFSLAASPLSSSSLQRRRPLQRPRPIGDGAAIARGAQLTTQSRIRALNAPARASHWAPRRAV
jgi:hypothetical protein